MKRRTFITLLAGSAAAWPLAARAQQQPALPVVGFVHVRSPEVGVAPLGGFRRGLAEAGYIEGQNVSVEYRWGRGRYDRLPEIVAELVRRPVAVLVAGADTIHLRARHQGFVSGSEHALCLSQRRGLIERRRALPQPGRRQDLAALRQGDAARHADVGRSASRRRQPGLRRGALWRGVRHSGWRRKLA
jgi:hypothetical protein